MTGDEISTEMINQDEDISVNFISKIKILENKITVLNLENLRYIEENEQHLKCIADLKSELISKNDHLLKNFEEAKRDKESMVLKFAQSEQKNIELKSKVLDLDGKLKEKIYNITQLTNERDKISKDLTSHIVDYSKHEKELSILKVSLTITEQKLKNEEIKFKEEFEKSKDFKKKYEELNRNLLVLKEENRTLRSNCQDIVKSFQTSEDMKSNSLTNSIKQIKDDLKKSIEERREAQENFHNASTELMSIKQTVNNQNQELKLLKDKLKHSEAERMCQEEKKKQLKEALRNLNLTKDQISERISFLEPFESQVLQLTKDVNRLTISNQDLEKIAKDCEFHVETLRQKESELLEFIQLLSNKNAELQSEKQELEKEKNVDQNQIYQFEKKYKDVYVKTLYWEEKFKTESKMWLEEKDNLIKEIKDLKSEIIIANQKLMDLDDQIYSINKRHKAHLKDLTRQLTKPGLKEPSGKNKIDFLVTTNESQNPSDNDGVLNQGNNVENVNKTNVDHIINFGTVNENGLPLTISQAPEIQMIEPHKNSLIEKIIRLQRLNAKFQEKIDFLNEHSVHLTRELQKKSFLLKFLFGEIEDKVSLKSDAVDENHQMMSKKGGIMASVYSSRQADQHMTLDLSLEISRRLQSVLEDTIIKNITLKESISTLGDEISKLKDENASLKKENERT